MDSIPTLRRALHHPFTRLILCLVLAGGLSALFHGLRGLLLGSALMAAVVGVMALAGWSKGTPSHSRTK